MKKVLILVLSCEAKPYKQMIQTSLETWDSVDVEGVETIYYCGKSASWNTDKIIYLPVHDQLETMGEKTLQAFEWALKNKKFDYVARVNSSCYVSKKKLLEYVQRLPDNNVFAGGEVTDTPRWMWGGYQFIYSKDVLQKIVDNRNLWNHNEMEDKAVSFLCDELKIPWTKIKGACSVNPTENGWLVLNSEEKNFEFNNFEDVKDYENWAYRVKHDGKRWLDEALMKELHNVKA